MQEHVMDLNPSITIHYYYCCWIADCFIPKVRL